MSSPKGPKKSLDPKKYKPAKTFETPYAASFSKDLGKPTLPASPYVTPSPVVGDPSFGSSGLVVQKNLEKPSEEMGVKMPIVDPAKDNNFVISSEFETSEDPIRKSLKKYWFDYGSDIQFSKTPYSSYLEIDKMSQTLGRFPDGRLFSDDVLRFTPIEDDFSSKLIDPTAKFQVFETLNTSDGTESPVEVYNYKCNQPIQYSSRHGNTVKSYYSKVDISFVYNYELINYENDIKEDNVEEASLLNFYTDNQKIKDAYTVAAVAGFEPSGGSKGSPTTTYSYSRDSKSNFDNEMVTKTIQKTNTDRNIIISETELENIKAKNEDLKNQKNISLPFHIKIDIGRSYAPSLSSELNSNINGLIVGEDGETVFDKVAKFTVDVTSTGANPEYFIKRNFINSYYSSEYSNDDQTDFNLNKQVRTEDLLLIDAQDMVNAIQSKSNIVNSGSPQITVVGQTSDLENNSDDIEDLGDIINDLLTKEKRIQNSYFSLLNGVGKFYETDIVFYKISKYDASDLTEPIQNIYVPNKTGEAFSYIDFQVKYGKRYTYEISAFKFVTGTEYNLSVKEPIDNSAFLSEILEYSTRRGAINAQVFLGGFSSAPLEFGYLASLGDLLSNLNAVISSGGASSAKIGKGADEANNIGLLASIKSLNQYFSTSDETVNAGTYLDQAIQTKIRSILGGVGIPSTNALLTDEIRDSLENLSRDITSYLLRMTGEAGGLLTKLKNVQTGGMGNSKSKRVTAAKSLKEDIEEIIEQEERIIDGLVAVKGTEVDNIEGTLVNSKDVYSITYPTIKLVEIPYYEDSGAILDNPPVFPDINFIPYKGNSRNISFFMNSGIGNILDDPVTFSEEEAEYYSLFRESKKYNDLEPILFKSDEVKNMAASFEIYRADFAPESYSDFENLLYKTISENFKEGSSSLSSVSYLEKIKPNKTYYYTFRQSDQRGVFSNPSEVFSVLLVDEGGVVFPIINQYQFPKEKKRYEGSGKKLINISPSINQATPRGLAAEGSYTKYSSGRNINRIMGSQQAGLYGKNFKIRFTSKKTGKKIDLNLIFEAKIV